MKKSLLTLLLSLFSTTLLAHPHAFLDMRNKVLIQNAQLQGFEMTWILDEITSSELIYEIQSSKNRKAAETKITEELNQSAVDNHYFSELYDEQNTPIKFKSKPLNLRLQLKTIGFSTISRSRLPNLKQSKANRFAYSALSQVTISI